MNKNLLDYASSFVSYFVSKLDNLENINKIILFGSVARGEAGKESDVDIFIDIVKSKKAFQLKINKITDDFYSSRQGLIFKNKGIDNKINLITGKLEDWKDLKKSIESTGKVLYGDYVASNVKGKKYAIFYWDKIGKNRGAFLNKLYGFKIKEKKYSGLIEEYNGIKIGKSSIMIPVIHKSNLENLIKKYKVNSRVIEVYY